MTKKQFLKKLKEALKIINPNEVEDIIKQYSSLIDEKVAMGMSEKEAIKVFGDVEEIASSIIKDYNKRKVFNDYEDDIKEMILFLILVKKL